MTSPDGTLDAIASAGFRLLLEEPFYAHLLASLSREVSYRVETAAVAWDGNQIRLVINPKFLASLTSDDECVAVLKHELLHVVFRHLFRQPARDPKLENIAADLVVNQLIAPWPLPTTAVTLRSFPDLELESDQSLEYYYDRLAHLRDPSTRRTEASQLPTRTTPVPTDAPAPRSAAELARLLSTGERGDHSLWSTDASRSAMAGRFTTEELLLRARERLGHSRWGVLPAGLSEAFADIMAHRQPAINWTRALRLFVSATGRTRIRHTMRKPSKRYGTRPGITVRRSRRLVVALDTSASIDRNALERFFIEVHGIWRSGALITIVECDAAVEAVYPYKGKTPGVTHGRGGTSFEPVFEWMHARPHFDGCVYLTDGVGADPVTKPPCPVLWAQSLPRAQPLPFGRTALLGTI